jgi:hypothetical protein
MQPIGEFRRQKVIDKTVPLDSATMFKLGGHDTDAIMRASALARARVPGVTIGLVDDVENNGIERRRQARDNSLLHDHGLSTPVKQIATLNILRWAGGGKSRSALDLLAFAGVGRFGLAPLRWRP